MGKGMIRIALAALAAWAPQSSLAVDTGSYERALEIADRHVARRKALKAAENGVPLPRDMLRSFAREVPGRSYSKGDRWRVVAFQVLPDGARTRVSALENPGARSALFEYRVTNVMEEGATLVVRQVAAADMPLVDPRVKEIELRLDGKQRQTAKIYHFWGGAESIPVAPEGTRSKVSLLELYPLDAFDTYSAERSAADRIPALPEDWQSLAERLGYRPQLSASGWYEQDDFFGRPLQALWKNGAPWPTFLRTPQGVALLIKVEGGA